MRDSTQEQHEQLVSTVNRNHSSQSDRDPIDRWAHIYTFVDIFRYDIGVVTRGTNVHHDRDKIGRNGESIGPCRPYQPRKHFTQPIGKVSVISRCGARTAASPRRAGERPGRSPPRRYLLSTTALPRLDVLFTHQIHLYYIIIIKLLLQINSLYSYKHWDATKTLHNSLKRLHDASNIIITHVWLITFKGNFQLHGYILANIRNNANNIVCIDNTYFTRMWYVEEFRHDR